MPEQTRVVVTGAHSRIGQAVVQRLCSAPDVAVTCVVTPWSRPHGMFPGVAEVIAADLTQAFPETLRRSLAEADVVVHLAWLRDTTPEHAIALNKEIVSGLTSEMASPERLIVLSSVGASPGAKSAYGQAKWAVAQQVEVSGGTVLVCGLVMSEPSFGPYALLAHTVTRLPVRPRFCWDKVPVYLNPLDDVCGAVLACALQPLAGGSYRTYPLPATDLNDVLDGLEAKGRTWRPVLPVPTRALLVFVRLLSQMRIGPTALYDKVLTFLYKDNRAYLDTLQPMDSMKRINK